MKLSDGEKLILLMLADIYKSLKIKGEFDPNFITATIFDNQLWGFNWELSGIPFEPSENPQEVTETADYLDMWSFIEEAYEALSPADKSRLEKAADPFGKDVQFPGFDGNHESHYGVALYLIKHLHRFSRFSKRDLNSHSASVEGYARMFTLFEPMRAATMGTRTLTVEELAALLNARRHPSIT